MRIYVPLSMQAFPPGDNNRALNSPSTRVCSDAAYAQPWSLHSLREGRTRLGLSPAARPDLPRDTAALARGTLPTDAAAGD